MGIAKEELAKIAFFKGFSDELLEVIAANAEYKNFSNDETITTEGGKANYFYVVKSGGVFILSEKWGNYDDDGEPAEVPIQKLLPGEVLGWSWITKEQRWTFDSTSSGNSELICIHTDPLVKHFSDNPKSGYEFLTHLIGVMRDRIVATRMNLALFTGEPFQTIEGG